MNRHLLLIAFFALLAWMPASAYEYRDTLETTKATAYSPADLLVGRISGVKVTSLDGNVNGESMLNIRGLNTLRGDSQPIWVVDGAILTSAGNQNADAFWQYGEMSYSSTLNSMAFLSAYEIESIEVVKDMSEAAKWGGNAANGVVLVKTKMQFGDERQISYDAGLSVGVSNVNADIFTPSVSHNHMVSISGGQKGSAYKVSAFYRNTDGIAVNQGANYGGASISYETHANSALQFGFHSILSKGGMNNTTGPAYFGQPSLLMLGRSPYLFPFNSEKGWKEDYDDKSDDNRTVNSMYLTFNFTPKLSLNLRVGADYRSFIRKIWFGNGTSFGKEMNGAASIMNSSLFNYNASADVSYRTYFRNGNRLTANMGVDGFGYVNRFNTMNGFDFFTHALRAEGLSLMKSHADIHSFDSIYGRVGAFAGVHYDFNGWVGLGGMFRAEKTGSFDWLDPSYYPAVDVDVNLKKLALGSVDFVSYARLSGGYGIGGREYLVPCQQLDVWLSCPYPSFQVGQDSYIDGFDRVRSAEYNIGLSIGLIKDRVELSAKYFNKTTDDKFLIFDSSDQDIKGFYISSEAKEIFSRLATIANRGIELDISATAVKTRAVKWDVAMNFTTCVNQVTGLDASETFGKKVGDGMYVNANAVGYQLGQLYGYLENADGYYKDVNKDGSISESDKQLLGDSAPKFYGGLSSTLTFGRFVFDLLMDGAAGHHVANLNGVVLDRKTDLSESYVEKADFMRLSKLAFSYTVPIKNKVIKSMRVSVAAQNILTITQYGGWNPDVNCFGRNVFTQGLDYGSYPITRNFVFGLNLKF